MSRILKEIKAGVPSEVSARKFGVPLDLWADWMTKTTPRYRALQAQVDQAEASATSDFVLMLRKAAKKKGSAAAKWLQARAGSYFPPTSRVALTLNQNNTLLAQVRAIVSEPLPPDPRRVLLEQEQPEREALPSAEPDAPAPLTFEPVINVVDAARPYIDPGVVEMVRALPSS